MDEMTQRNAALVEIDTAVAERIATFDPAPEPLVEKPRQRAVPRSNPEDNNKQVRHACRQWQRGSVKGELMIGFSTSLGPRRSRTDGFLACILPYSNAEWEKRSIFLDFLIPKRPAPKEEDLSKGILEAIDMDSYRAEVKSTLTITP